MENNKFNKSPMFPFTYGDLVENDDIRLSNRVVKFLQNKKTQNYLKSVMIAVFVLSTYAPTGSAIPAEYGEVAANAAQHAEYEIPPTGTFQGHVNGPNHQHNPMGNVNQANPPKVLGGPYILPKPPITPLGRTINTVGILVSIGWICINSYWGNPMFTFGCIGIAGGMVNELRKTIFN